MESAAQLILEQNVDGIVVVDDQGTVRFVNRAAERLFDRPASMLLDQPFGFPLLRGDRAEIDIVRQDGDERIAEMWVMHLPWDGMSASVVSLRDITDRIRAEETLRDTEALNRAVLNSLDTHIAVLDDRGVIVAVNEAWMRFAYENGADAEDPIGVGVDYLSLCRHAAGPDADEAAAVLGGLEAVLSGERGAFELEYPCHAPDRERWFLMRVVPLHGARTRGMVVAHTDITAQKRVARIEAEANALREMVRGQVRELRALNRVSPAPSSDQLPLREREAGQFTQAVESYARILDRSLEQRAFKRSTSNEAATRAMAETLGRVRANPRDVIEIHMTALRNRSTAATHQKIQAYIEEGRVAVLELMGHLAAFYRTIALSVPDLVNLPTLGAAPSDATDAPNLGQTASG